MQKLYYTISEVADSMEETTVTIRYWSNTFSAYLNPKRNAKGNRLYTAKDLAVLNKIQYLTRDCGLSLDGVAHKLKDNASGEDKTLKIRDSLLEIKRQLLEIKETL